MRKLVIVFLAIGVALLLIGSWWAGFSPSGKGLPPDFGLHPMYGLDRPFTTKVIMQLAISVLLMIASLFVILSARYGPKDKHWAYGTVGTLLGFWFQGGTATG